MSQSLAVVKITEKVNSEFDCSYAVDVNIQGPPGDSKANVSAQRERLHRLGCRRAMSYSVVSSSAKMEPELAEKRMPARCKLMITAAPTTTETTVNRIRWPGTIPDQKANTHCSGPSGNKNDQPRLK